VNFSDGTINKELFAADRVIVAAGSNSSLPVLRCLVPLVQEPGVMVHIRQPENIAENTTKLKRIFVDTISKSHILRRSDGTLVIGGGQLVVGGTTSQEKAETKHVEKTNSHELVGRSMLENAASSILPLQLKSQRKGLNVNNLVRVIRANRPMPSDGLPIVGFVDSTPGLYVAVTHSGITLGPLLGELAAYEIANSLDERDEPFELDILDKYRPSRFQR
jgi:glycine/D-amino acid oxidase-like deaminating enzyme